MEDKTQQSKKFADIFKEVISQSLRESGKEHDLGEIKALIIWAPDNTKNQMEYIKLESFMNRVGDDESDEETKEIYKKLCPTEDNSCFNRSLKERDKKEIYKKIDNVIKDKIVIKKAKQIERRSPNGAFTDKANAIIIIMLEKSKSGYEGIFEYAVLELLKIINTDEELKNLADANKAQEYLNPFRRNWFLFGGYAESYLQKNGFPETKELITLSAARYEGSESDARIYFSKNEINIISKLIKPEEDERVIGENDKVRMIRKLMELSKRNTVYLYAEKMSKKDSSKVEQNKFIVTELVEVDKEKKDKNDKYVRFSGYLCWSIFDGEKEVLTYKEGKYEVNHSDGNEIYMEAIRKLKNKYDQKKLKDIVKVLKKQKHGTIAIISDCNSAGDIDNKKTEIGKFCAMNRAIALETPISYIEEEKILSLTSVDGALFMDLEGRCFAFSVLLDGVATIKGDVGRGSRFNSVKNYVKQKTEGFYIGIIVSEDGMVNIVSNCKYSDIITHN